MYKLNSGQIAVWEITHVQCEEGSHAHNVYLAYRNKAIKTKNYSI